MMKNNTVLFVDDEALVLNSLRRELRKENYRSLFASNGMEALEIMEKEKVNVIVTDMRMPKMNGLELLKIVREKYPVVTRIVLSGYTQLPQIIATINNGDIFKFIPKPWKFDEEFKPAIDEALEYNNLKLRQKELMEELIKKNQTFEKDFDKCNFYNIDFKQEINKIKELNTNGLNLIKRANLEIKSEDSEEIKNLITDIYIEWFNSYLEILPLSENSFNLSNLVKTLQEYLRDKYIDNITLHTIGSLQHDIKTDYDFTLWILKQIAKVLMQHSQDEKKVLAIKVEDKINIVQVRFFTRVSITQGQISNSLSHRNRVLIETKIKLLKELLNGISGYIEYRISNDNIYLELIINSSK